MEEMADEMVASGSGDTDDITLHDLKKKFFDLYKIRVAEHDLIRKDPLH